MYLLIVCMLYLFILLLTYLCIYIWSWGFLYIAYSRVLLSLFDLTIPVFYITFNVIINMIKVKFSIFLFVFYLSPLLLNLFFFSFPAFFGQIEYFL